MTRTQFCKAQMNSFEHCVLLSHEMQARKNVACWSVYGAAYCYTSVSHVEIQCECRSDSARTSPYRELLGLLPVHRDQRPPETVRQTPIQQVESTQGDSICSQLVPAPANIRPACHHSTRSHPNSSVRYFANCPDPTPPASLNQRARHCHQVARVQQWELLVAVLMTMMIHHA